MKKFFLRVDAKPQGLEQAAHDLKNGQHRDNILEQAIRVLELDPSDDSLGYGGFPNLTGDMELDAAFMDGNSRNYGAVAGVGKFLPVRIARRLMQYRMHTFLAGAGAEIFAHESGLQEEPTLLKAQRERWQGEIEPLLNRRGQKTHMDIVRNLAFPAGKNMDTTVMIVSDGNGLSGASSTSGWPYKHPGRIGDAPIIGAGLYVDSRYGASCCTYTGEMSMRGAVARYVVDQIENGKSPRDAVLAAVDNISYLDGGLLMGLNIHAIDTAGNAHVVAMNADAPMFYSYWNEDMAKPETRPAEILSVSYQKLQL